MQAGRENDEAESGKNDRMNNACRNNGMKMLWWHVKLPLSVFAQNCYKQMKHPHESKFRLLLTV